MGSCQSRRARRNLFRFRAISVHLDQLNQLKLMKTGGYRTKQEYPLPAARRGYFVELSICALGAIGCKD